MDDVNDWWGNRDTRPRCWMDNKIIFETQEDAEESLEEVRMKGDDEMKVYKGKCKHWHLGHSKF